MTIPIDGLISPFFSLHTAAILYDNQSETLSYYIEEYPGWEYIGDYGYAYSLGHSIVEATFIQQVFETLDPLIDLDFQRVYSDWGSNIDIYCVDYGAFSSYDILGQADRQAGWWDVMWLDTDGLTSLNSNDAYSIVHEIGHTLGLSHPYEDPWNSQWNSDDTVMSYNFSPDSWDNWFSDSDIAALQSIWGVENDYSPQQPIGQGTNSPDQLSGGDGNDSLKGFGGADYLDGGNGDDFIHGHWGRDNITGGLGNDELRGGDGGDTIYGGNGADVIWGGGHKNTLDAGINDSSVDQIFIHADASLYDLPRDGSYADSLVAIGYEDQIFIHGVDDSALSFGVASMPNDPSQTGIGIYANGVLEATVGGNFTADQVNAMTTGGFFA